MGNYSEFRNAIKKVESVLMNKKFDYDINVSVFETTIRILAGLLSAHLLSIDETLEIYVSVSFILDVSDVKRLTLSLAFLISARILGCGVIASHILAAC
jgi:hypothetical protein